MKNMLPFAICDIIMYTFEKENTPERNMVMHVGFRAVTNREKFRIHHLYLWKPANELYFFHQQETVLENGSLHLTPLDLVNHSLPCWRGAMLCLLGKLEDEITVLNPFDSKNWYDIIGLTIPLWGAFNTAVEKWKESPDDPQPPYVTPTFWKP